MPRAIWKGSLSFGLVSIPVELHAAYEKRIHELYAEIGRLTTQVNFLKKKLPS